MLDFIKLNGIPYRIDDPQPAQISKIGSGVTRSLSGKGSEDIICRKHKFSYNFIPNNIEIVRLAKIFDSNAEVTLVDQYEDTYTVLVGDTWQPTFEGISDGKEIYTITMNFEEV
jgi:hypothetical protein